MTIPRATHSAFSDAIEIGDIQAFELAKSAAEGEFEEYDDLPSRAEFREVVDLLQQNGLE